MTIQINKKYIFRVDVKKTLLTFTGIVTSIDDIFISFKDNYDKIHNWNRSAIISYEEISQ